MLVDLLLYYGGRLIFLNVNAGNYVCAFIIVVFLCYLLLEHKYIIMSLIKHKLLKMIGSEDELDYNENPFVGHILTTNQVVYFRGLFMKVWATGPFMYKTQKVNKDWTFTYGRGTIQLSDGQDYFDVANLKWNGTKDEEGFRYFVFLLSMV